jgi:hypothetical protein
MSLIYRMAKRAELGGKTYVKERRGEREAEYQITGQIGEYVGCKLLLGDRGEKVYRRKRFFHNIDPWKGDNGSDIQGAPIDFKCSLMRNLKKSPMNYNLIINEGERHPHWNYFLLLVERYSLEGALVHVMGWATDDMVECHFNKGGTFRGKYTIPAKDLHPLHEWQKPVAHMV